MSMKYNTRSSRKPQIGVIRAWDAKQQIGRIHHPGNRRDIFFELGDLQDIEPEVGMRVVFYRKRDRAIGVRPWKPVAASQTGGQV
jgi:hypothetical protein